MLINTSISEILAAAAIASGGWLAISSLRRQVSRSRRRALLGPTELLGLARSFRRFIFGAALAGVGAGVLAEISWLVTLSLIIGGEEILESSIVAAALRDEEKRRDAEAHRSTAAAWSH